MSTRGCVAVGTLSEWRGVYNHYDSYPTGLGKDVWGKLQGLGPDALAEQVMQYGDWEELCNNGRCPYCGCVGVGAPHSIRHGIGGWARGTFPEFLHGPLSEYDRYCKRNLETYGCVDPWAKYHEHRGPDEKAPITNECSDPVVMEWLYVIDLDARKFHVLTYQPCGQETSGAVDYGDHYYRYVPVASLDFDAEADWEWIERIGEEVGSITATGIPKSEVDNAAGIQVGASTG